MNKSKIFMIVGICMLCISVVGSAVAFYYKETTSFNANTITYGLDYYIEYAKGEDINVEGLTPVTSYTEGSSSDIELWKVDNTYDIYGHIYIDIEELSDLLSNSFALSYTLVNDGDVISEGEIQSNDNNRILVKANIPLQTTKELYTLYVWLNEEYSDSRLSSEYVSLSVSCEATMEKISTSSGATLATNFITQTYKSSSPTSTYISAMKGTYLYSASARIVNDGKNSTGGTVAIGNLRYFCSSATECDSIKNYIYFNCDNYSDVTTCETWRILGLIDGKVKIVRSAPIGEYSYDLTATGEYNHLWPTSTLSNLLNDGYYYNKDGIKYYNQSSTPITVNFKSDGIGITPATRKHNLIADTNWYFNNISTVNMLNSSLFAQAYSAERNVTYVKNGKIAILSPTEMLTSSVWMYRTSQIFTKTTANWALNSQSATGGIYINNTTGIFGANMKAQKAGVVPVLYLNTNVKIKGTGTSTNPYRIVI